MTTVTTNHRAGGEREDGPADGSGPLERARQEQGPFRPSGPVLAHGTLDDSRRWVAFGDLSGSIPEELFQQVVAELAEQRRPLAEARPAHRDLDRLERMR